MGTTAWWHAEWVWAGTGWVLCALGVVVLAWALLWDRARGRRRCPKCWYDMSAAVAVERDGKSAWVCPECGREVSHERDMAQTRRRWRWVGASCVLMAAAWTAASVPQVQISGWPGFIPSTVEILVLPWLERPSPAQQQLVAQSPALLDVRERLFVDLRINRLDAKRLWAWQRWLLYERLLSGDTDVDGARDRFYARYEGYVQLIADGKQLSRRQQFKFLDWIATWPLRMRTRWPADTPVPVALHMNTYFDDSTMGRVLRATPVGVSGDAWESPTMGPAWWRDATDGGAWKRHVSEIGPVVEGTKSVTFDLEIVEFDRAAWDAGIRSGTSAWKRRVSMPIDARGTVEDFMQGVPAPLFAETKTTFREAAARMAAGLPVSLPGGDHEGAMRQFERLREYQEGKATATHEEVFSQVGCRLLLPSGRLEWNEVGLAIREKIIELDMVICALRFDILREGHLVATGSAWGIGAPRTGGRNYGEGELVMGMGPPMALKWWDQVPSPHDAAKSKWVLRIVGDPRVALGYDGSDRYWKGQVEFPLDPADDPNERPEERMQTLPPELRRLIGK